MLKFAVVDDECGVAGQTEQCLFEACSALQVKAEIDVYGSGKEAISFLEKNDAYHIIFLDIEMAECNGIEVSRYIREALRNETIQIVYVSGKDGYDRQLFEFRPFHFLPKPVNVEKLKDVLSKYIRIYGQKQEMFAYKSGHGTFFVKKSEIIYFESNDRKIKMKTLREEREFYGLIRDIQEQLIDNGFFVPHKSYVVNYSFVKSFLPEELIMLNDDRIPIAKGKRKEVMKFQLMMEHGGR